MLFISLDNLQRFHTNLLNVLSGKQDELVSGENICTINGISLLNGGNIDISAEHGTLVYDNLPTYESNNLVKSGGIYNAIEEVNNRITQLHNETVLFESSTVNYNNITLSDSVVNYDYIEVFGETTEGHLLYTKLFNPDGKKFVLSTSPVFLGSYAGNFHFLFKEYGVSGNTLTGNSGNSGDIEVTSNGKHNQTNNTSTVGITKVIGHKNI